MKSILKRWFRQVAWLDENHCYVRSNGYEWCVEACKIFITVDCDRYLIDGYRAEAYLPGEYDYEVAIEAPQLEELCSRLSDYK